MTDTAMTTHADKPIARPLKVLVPMIRDDLRQGDEASQRAALPYHRAAGEKMIEAKGQMKHGEFAQWIKRNFKIGERQARLYMSYARATADRENGAQEPRSLHQFRVDRGQRQTVYPQPWHQPVKEIINRVDVARISQESLKRAEERDLQRKLALQLIDIGYKALATKLHPDKGGSREAMARLNTVRNRLKESA